MAEVFRQKATALATGLEHDGEDLTTTQRYMHLSPTAVESTIRLLDRRAPSGEMLETAEAES